MKELQLPTSRCNEIREQLECFANASFNFEERIMKYQRYLSPNSPNKLLEKILKDAKTKDIEFQELETKILDLEQVITDYLAKDQKIWESFDVRENIRAWVSYIKDIPQLMDLLLMFNERNKSPYKYNPEDNKNKKKALKASKIIGDNDIFTVGQFSPIDLASGKLNPYSVNPNLELGNKTRLWSKDFEGLNLEDIYVRYISSAKSFPSAFIATYLFMTVCSDLGKRREFYKKKDELEAEVNTVSNLLERSKREIKFNVKEKEKLQEDYKNLEMENSELQRTNVKLNRLTHGKLQKKNTTNPSAKNTTTNFSAKGNNN